MGGMQRWVFVGGRRVGGYSPYPGYMGNYEIRLTSGLYASYWNDFLCFTCYLFPPPEDSASAFLPAKFDEFNLSVTLTPQYARGRHFVAAHDKSKNIYKVTLNIVRFLF